MGISSNGNVSVLSNHFQSTLIVLSFYVIIHMPEMCKIQYIKMSNEMFKENHETLIYLPEMEHQSW